MQLRAISLSFAMVGIFFLAYLILSPAEKINSLTDQDFHKIISLDGKVTKERISGEQHYFNIGEVPVRCSCKNLYLDGKNVRILGFVEEYQEKLYLRVLRIIIL